MLVKRVRVSDRTRSNPKTAQQLLEKRTDNVDISADS